MDLAATKRLLTAAAAEGQIHGNLAAVDSAGRFAAHDSRQPALEYFTQRLRQDIPAGLDHTETARRAGAAQARHEQSLFINRFLTWFVGLFIALVIIGRLVLVRERARQYRKTAETPLPHTL